MASYSLSITDADAEASALLRRSRDDGYDSVTVPYDQDSVDAWRLGASQPGMDVLMMHKLLEVCEFALRRTDTHLPVHTHAAQCARLHIW